MQQISEPQNKPKTEFKGKMDKTTITVRNINTPHPK